MSAGYMSGYQKLDIAILPQAGVAETAMVSRPYDMSKYEKALFIVSAGSMGSTGMGSTSGIVWGRILQLPSTSTGGAIAAFSNSSFSAFYLGSTNSDAITNVQSIILTCGSSGRTGESITLWGKSSASAVTFTASTSIASTVVTATTDFLYSTSSELTNIALKLVNQINDSTCGVEGLFATAASTTVSVLNIRPKNAGECAISILASVTAPTSSGAVRPVVGEALGYLAINAADLSVSSSYRYIMLELTPSSGFQVSAMLLRGSGRYSPTQYVAGYKTGGAT